MQRVFAPASALHRLAAGQVALCASSSSSSSVLAAWHQAAAQPAHVRAMSAGTKRDNKNGIPLRRAGGIHLPDDEHTVDSKGRERYKSARQEDREEAAAERRQARDAADAQPETIDTKIGQRTAKEFKDGSKEDHALLRQMMQREPLREGEQLFRERTLKKSGIHQLSPLRVDIRQKLKQRAEKTPPPPPSQANPVLVRTRAHMNPIDLPPSFDHFTVPPLSSEEVDAKQKALHATYWDKYEAWKEARPEEYQKWLARLEKREMEQEYHWQRSQGVSDAALLGLTRQSVRRMLPEEHRDSFLAAVQTDSALKDAVAKLGEDEVLRRWSAYQVFLDAEIQAAAQSSTADRKVMQKLVKDRALFAEDTLETLHNPDLRLNLTQKKKVYHMLTSAKRRVEDAPFWTDPDPRFEGEHDWKMTDAYLKPGVLPPLHLLKHLPARPELNMNFSPLHKFLHFERLRQTMHFVREARKKITRVKKRKYQPTEPLLAELLAKKPAEWSHIQVEYPFLSDALLKGVANLYRAPWAPADKVEFVKALHKNVVTTARLLDVHFARENRNADWILPFPNAARTNPDEVLRPMSKRQVREMEEEVRRAAQESKDEEEQQASEEAEQQPKATAAAGQQ